MGKDQLDELLIFLKPFGEEITDLVLSLREFVWDLYPTANELIYDNYTALAFGWSPTQKVGHTFCSIAVGRTSKNIHFGFYWGNELDDPEKLLLGKGHQYRYILVKNRQQFPEAYIKILLNQAFNNSLSKVKDQREITEGITVVKSISETKRVKKNESEAR